MKTKEKLKKEISLDEKRLLDMIPKGDKILAKAILRKYTTLSKLLILRELKVGE